MVFHLRPLFCWAQEHVDEYAHSKNWNAQPFDMLFAANCPSHSLVLGTIKIQSSFSRCELIKNHNGCCDFRLPKKCSENYTDIFHKCSTSHSTTHFEQTEVHSISNINLPARIHFLEIHGCGLTLVREQIPWLFPQVLRFLFNGALWANRT